MTIAEDYYKMYRKMPRSLWDEADFYQELLEEKPTIDKSPYRPSHVSVWGHETYNVYDMIFSDNSRLQIDWNYGFLTVKVR